MKFDFQKCLAAAAIVGGLCFGAAGVQAATVTLDFGNQPGNYSPYQEDGYNVSANANGSGSVQLDNSVGNCPLSDPACLHVSGSNPGTAFIERQDGKTFDAFSFLINFAGNGNQNYVSFDNGPSFVRLALGTSYSDGVYLASTLVKVTGAVAKGKDYFIDLSKFAVADGKASSFFTNISELSIETGGGAANVRVDNVVLSAVPVPAAGLMFLIGLGALGGVAALKRRNPRV